MNTTPISFADLRNMDISNTVVVLCLIVPEDQDWDEANKFFQEDTEFAPGKNITGCHRITGNVLGDDGRWDYLFEFDHPEIPFNPVARLKFSDIKWTGDYIDNYAKDFEGND